MIRAMGLYKEIEPELAWRHYANNSFCDQFNAITQTYEAFEKGSSVGYEHYIRFPYKNIEQATPLKFSVRSFRSSTNSIIGYTDLGYPIYEHKSHLPSHILIEVISPSEEYD